ncbi:UNVERIFIED_CONTAM: Pectinesterase 2 [Sesamum radiatum]|uniref:Pectinesterase 2 n=1 Tax=Sesamum radiatum TaxID=300843 RepID=A0AAW2KCA8_SESRA
MQKLSYVAVEVVFVTALLVLPIVLSTNDEPIPADKAQLNSWFDRNVGPLASREGSLDPAVVEAEKNVTVVQVRADGSGDFKTITDAVKSVPRQQASRGYIHWPWKLHRKSKDRQVYAFHHIVRRPEEHAGYGV